MRPSIPEQGRSRDQLLEEMKGFFAADADWRGGRVFSLVYHLGEEHERFLSEAHALYASTNGLNPMAFKSLRRMEAEVVSMAASLFHGPDSTVGAITSGGTESLLVAVQTYRDRARAEMPRVRRPEIIVPRTIHPAFDKAAHYFGVKLVKIDVREDLRADPKAMARAISGRTIALAVSAPQYPHGVMDPIAELGVIAEKAGLPLHVDACIGGFILPWLERLGRPLSPWDFRVNGVTSISADLHKYGYAGKGASVLLWRSMDFMRHQFFVATDWPGGIYVSPSMPGTRPGGPIAAAWAALSAIGADGYLAAAKASIEAVDKLRAALATIPEIRVLGAPDATIVSWGAQDPALDVYAVADRLEARGWTVDRQQRPASVHLTVTANHAPVIDRYVADLRAAIDEVKRDPSLEKSGSAPMYGMMAKIPMRGMVAGSVRKVMEAMYAPNKTDPTIENVSGDGFVGRLVERYGARATELIDQVERVRERVRKALS
ncbi:MAG: aminotransferase class V-fold PLP-dependent enzyme [Myxococcota bacterium]